MKILPLSLLAFFCFCTNAFAHSSMKIETQQPRWSLASLWWRPDQQGARSLAQGHPKKAAKEFSNPAWRGVAQYLAGQYAESIETLKSLKGVDNQYNYANALAHAGQYREAIQQYKNILEQNPHQADAKFNKQLVEKLLKQKHKAPKQKKPKNTKKNHSPNPRKKPKNAKQPKPNRLAKLHAPKPDPKTKHWLKKIPDNPGGLLQRKFLRDYMRRRGA